MPLSKDHAIIAQNAATAAATLLQNRPDGVEQFEAVRTAIFQNSLALGGAETVVQVMETPVVPVDAPVSVAAVAPALVPAPVAAPPAEPSVLGGGGFQNDAGAGVAFKFGKFAGQTIGQVAETKPDYLVWAETNLTNNAFMQGKIREFLTANPHVRAAAAAAA